MRYVRLICAVDDDGITGLKLKGTPSQHTSNSALEGRLIAHDIIEHQNGPAAIGGFVDEFEALGAMWYVRGEQFCWGDVRAATNEEPIWQELVHLAHYYGNKDWPGWWEGEIAPDYRVFSDMLEEVECFPEFLGLTSSNQYRFRNEVIKHLNIGYRKAKRRFRNQYDAYDLFAAIECAVDDLVRQNELIPGFEWSLGYGNGGARWYPRNHRDEAYF